MVLSLACCGSCGPPTLKRVEEEVMSSMSVVSSQVIFWPRFVNTVGIFWSATFCCISFYSLSLSLSPHWLSHSLPIRLPWTFWLWLSGTRTFRQSHPLTILHSTYTMWLSVSPASHTSWLSDTLTLWQSEFWLTNSPTIVLTMTLTMTLSITLSPSWMCSSQIFWRNISYILLIWDTLATILFFGSSTFYSTSLHALCQILFLPLPYRTFLSFKLFQVLILHYFYTRQLTIWPSFPYDRLRS